MVNRSNLYVITGLKDVAMMQVVYTICGYDMNTNQRYEFATKLKHQGQVIGTSYQLINKVCDIVIDDPQLPVY